MHAGVCVHVKGVGMLHACACVCVWCARVRACVHEARGALASPSPTHLRFEFLPPEIPASFTRIIYRCHTRQPLRVHNKCQYIIRHTCACHVLGYVYVYARIYCNIIAACAVDYNASHTIAIVRFSPSRICIYLVRVREKRHCPLLAIGRKVGDQGRHCLISPATLRVSSLSLPILGFFSVSVCSLHSLVPYPFCWIACVFFAVVVSAASRALTHGKVPHVHPLSPLTTQDSHSPCVPSFLLRGGPPGDSRRYCHCSMMLAVLNKCVHTG